ncbi:ankyrin [Zopfia rhizophila CBS 207.26]|uniref:Ankyrin n=1 Tax=Zopfia rhizophila CBS 207.26 TaxID=1314779 RepID=A0A6A6DPR0_9PEZI|nr:ankyrin [Zopfia rhizophila CBS 207.26]
MQLLHLPAELLLEIATYLSLKSLAALCLVNRQLYYTFIKPLYRQDYSCSALLWAANGANEKTIELSLRYGADINTTDENGCTPLSLAAKQGHQSVVELLLARNELEVFSQDKGSRTALSWASRSGHGMVVDLLLSKDPEDLIYHIDDTLLEAVWFRQAAIVERLLATELVDISHCGAGAASLCSAAEDGEERIVELLLAAGVSPNVYHGRKKSALLLAAEGRHSGTMKLLLEAGAYVNSKDFEDRTPLMQVAEQGYKEGVELLLGAGGVNLNARDVDEQTALSLAVLGGHGETAELLSVAGRTNVYYTACHA